MNCITYCAAAACILLSLLGCNGEHNLLDADSASEKGDIVVDGRNWREVTYGHFNAAFGLDASTSVEAYWNSSVGIKDGFGGWFSGRHNHNNFLSRYGVDFDLEEYTKRGLKWLVSNQKENGSWEHTNEHGKFPTLRLTGICLLAFLSFKKSGHKDFDNAITKAVRFLVKKIGSNGLIGGDVAGVNMEAHAICTLSLIENYGMWKKQPIAKKPAKKALDALLAKQTQGSGWGIDKAKGCDALTTCWALLAAKSAAMSGLVVTEKSILNAKKYLESITNPKNNEVAYKRLNDRELIFRNQSFAISTVFTNFIKRIMGVGREPAGMKDLRERLARADRDRCFQERDYQYVWLFSLMLFQLGGDEWTNWISKMNAEMKRSQTIVDSGKGYWKATGSESDIEATAFSVLTLETYYSYKRLD